MGAPLQRACALAAPQVTVAMLLRADYTKALEAAGPFAFVPEAEAEAYALSAPPGAPGAHAPAHAAAGLGSEAHSSAAAHHPARQPPSSEMAAAIAALATTNEASHRRLAGLLATSRMRRTPAELWELSGGLPEPLVPS
jgi:hypothetical protein